MIVAAVSLAVLALVYRRFLFALPSSTRRGFVLAAILYVGGALGLELAAGWYADAMGESYYDWGGRVVLTHIEEVMEMSGVVVLINTLVEYLRTEIGPLRLTFDSDSSPPG